MARGTAALGPALRASTFAAIIATTTAAVLAIVVVRASLGLAGERDMGAWLYASVVALVVGIPGTIAALSNVGVTPAWQWRLEFSACVVSVVIAVVVTGFVLF